MSGVDEFLEHYGVKGMHWGERHDRGHEGQKATLKKIAKLDKKFEDKMNSKKVRDGAFKDATKVYATIQPEIEHFFGQEDFKKNPKAKAAYNREVLAAIEFSYQIGLNRFGINASGTKGYKADMRPNGDIHIKLGDVTPEQRQAFQERAKKNKRFFRTTNALNVVGDVADIVTHTSLNSVSDDMFDFVIRPIRDELGHIIRFELVEDDMEQSDISDEEFLEHYGVKGMHWGQRKAPGSRPSLRSRIKTKFDDPEFQRKYIQSRGDTRKRTHYRRSAKSLSDAELHRRIARMNLERQYNDLNDGKNGPNQIKIKKGKEKADGFIKKAGKGAAQDVLKRGLTNTLTKTIQKSAKGARFLG